MGRYLRLTRIVLKLNVVSLALTCSHESLTKLDSSGLQEATRGCPGMREKNCWSVSFRSNLSRISDLYILTMNIDSVSTFLDGVW